MAVEGYYSISIHAPLLIDGEVKGSTATLVKWDAFSNWFRKARVSPGSFTVLLDPEERVIYHPNSDCIGKTLTELHPVTINGERLSVDYFLKNRAGVMTGPFFKNEKHIVACCPFAVGSKRYSLISCAPYTNIIVPVAMFHRRSNILAGLAFLIVFLSLIYTSYLFHRDKQKSLKFQHELQEEIREHKKTEKKLKQMDRVRAEFLSHVSHELRTPLTSIMESVSLVLDGTLGKINNGQVDFLALAQNEVKRLARLVNGLLDISRIEEGKIEIKRRPINMHFIIKQVRKDMEADARKQGISLKLELAPHLPLAYVDPDKTTQILTNLV
ncbi:sensor histidine kinase, partial [bacterium]|nr:sensor histidine kinase [bacterium]